MSCANPPQIFQNLPLQLKQRLSSRNGFFCEVTTWSGNLTLWKSTMILAYRGTHSFAEPCDACASHLSMPPNTKALSGTRGPRGVSSPKRISSTNKKSMSGWGGYHHLVILCVCVLYLICFFGCCYIKQILRMAISWWLPKDLSWNLGMQVYLGRSLIRITQELKKAHQVPQMQQKMRLWLYFMVT